jgi:lipoprotein NlpI
MIAVMVLCAPICILAGDQGTAKTAREHYQQGVREYDKRHWDLALQSLNRCLQLDSAYTEAWQLRGCVQFLRGKFTESVADFDRYLKLAPEKADAHWQRGISLYYAGRYAEGKEQFGRYEKVDRNDVENAVWHFLCAAKKDGVAKARAAMLPTGKDPRVPMMTVYELFRGMAKPADVLAAAKAGKATEETAKRQLFYAHLYLGLYHDALGEAAQARDHLALAATTYRIPEYMGDVARVHHELLSKAKK